jgi:hypothetical protein
MSEQGAETQILGNIVEVFLERFYTLGMARFYI